MIYLSVNDDLFTRNIHQKAQEKVDELSQKLLELQEMKQSIEAKQIMDAFRKSGKSMQELMTFLDV